MLNFKTKLFESIIRPIATKFSRPAYPRRFDAGLAVLTVVVGLGVIVTTVFGIKQMTVISALKQVEHERARATIQRKISSAANMVASLLSSKHILATGDANLIRYVPAPDTASVGLCATPSPDTEKNAGIWHYFPKTGATNPRIEIDLCSGATGEAGCSSTSGESLVLNFTGRDATGTSLDSDFVFGQIKYTAPSGAVGPKTATYNLRLEVFRLGLNGPNKCAIFIGTRGSHSTSDYASTSCGIPNWSAAAPRYNRWKMAVPHPADLATSTTWVGAIGSTRWKSALTIDVHQAGHFSPCNRTYAANKWSCCAQYDPVPLQIRYCGVQLHAFTNHTPGSGTCDADCRCYLSTQVSPLVIDFDEKGVLFTQGLHQQVKFDMGGGPSLHTPWIRAGQSTAFLVFDRNTNGTIDSVHELFGDATVLPDGTERDNGFETLAFYDDNVDGVISPSDKVFKDLQVWFDRNGDAITDPGELQNIKTVGISSIDLAFEEGNFFVDEEGNHARYSGQVKFADGRDRLIYDIYFAGAGSAKKKTLEPSIDRRLIVFQEN